MSILPALLLRGACVAALLVAASPATASSGVALTIQDDALFLHGTDEEVAEAMQQAVSLGFDRVRLTAGWSVLAPDVDSPQPPEGFDATDPEDYPRGAWANLDRAVRTASAAGIKPMIDIAFWAPRWATTTETIGERYRKDIDPQRFADFARAVATRYAGGYAPPAPAPAAAAAAPPASPDVLGQLFGRPAKPAPAEPAPAAEIKGEPLPGVDLFTLWNEPNHSGFLGPQWQMVNGTWRARSPHLYRAMVELAYPAVKAVAPGSRVLIGATAAMGSSAPGGTHMTPGRFLRELACVDAKLQPILDGECANFHTVPGDGWSHHPYSLRTTPDVTPSDPDKLPVGATGRLAALLKSLVAAGRLAPANADLYLTEYGYETSPPDPRAPFSPEQQGPLLAWAESIATSVPAVRMWAQFQLRDRPDNATSSSLMPFSDWQSGLFFADGRPKPAVESWTRPVSSRCVRAKGRRWVEVWGRLRSTASGSVAVERLRKGGWKPTASAAQAGRRGRLAQGSVGSEPRAGVRRFVKRRSGERYRLRWTAGNQTVRSPESTPVGC